MTAESIAKALGGHRAGATWMARWPAHEDCKPSLSINSGKDGKVLVRCHAGCDQCDVIAILRQHGLWETTRKSGGRFARKRQDRFSDEPEADALKRSDLRGVGGKIALDGGFLLLAGVTVTAARVHSTFEERHHSCFRLLVSQSWRELPARRGVVCSVSIGPGVCALLSDDPAFQAAHLITKARHFGHHFTAAFCSRSGTARRTRFPCCTRVQRPEAARDAPRENCEEGFLHGNAPIGAQ